jgi:hypothetical protein
LIIAWSLLITHDPCRYEKQVAEQELDRLEEQTRKADAKKRLQEEAGMLDPMEQMEQTIGT